MLFATRAVRRAIGLEAEPVCDPDVAAGRLVNADPYLASVLYGEAARQPLVAAPPPPLDDSRLSVTRSAWDIAREQYASSNTVYVLPDGRELRGSTITNWSKVPIGTRVVLDAASEASDDDETVKVLGVDGKTAREIAGEEYARASTIYFLSNGVVRTGAELRESAFPALPAGTRMLVGYVYGGRITSSRQAFEVCGRQWNYPSTFYRLPSGEVRAGNTMDENSIPRGTLVFFQE